MSSNLEAYGWNSFFSDHFGPQATPELAPGRVVALHRGAVTLQTATGPSEAVLGGRLRHFAEDAEEIPVVGDWVAYLRPDPSGPALVHAVLPRRSHLSRKVAGSRSVQQILAANVDRTLVVMGLDGDYNPRRLERFLVMLEEGGTQPAVVLNKLDLCNDPASRIAETRRVATGAPVIAVSAKLGDLAQLEPLLAAGSTAALVGSSGVGKSTIINRLRGDDRIRTAAVRSSDSRGRHTTTHRELFRLPGGALLIDNPGIRELQIWSSGDGLQAAFQDIHQLAENCRFRDCSHLHEPGCAVRQAIADDRLEASRLENLRTLEKEERALARRRDVRSRRQDAKRLGRLYKSVQADKRRRWDE